MAEIARLHGGAALPIPVVREDVVEKLEELLELARSGEIAGFAFAVVTSRKDINTAWKGNADRHDMIAATAMLVYRVVSAGVDSE